MNSNVNVWIFFLNISFIRTEINMQVYMNWDVKQFFWLVTFLITEKIGDWNVWNQKRFLEGLRCFAGEKSILNSPVLLFHLCFNNKSQVFLSVYMYVDCSNSDNSCVGDDACITSTSMPYLPCYNNNINNSLISNFGPRGHTRL